MRNRFAVPFMLAFVSMFGAAACAQQAGEDVQEQVDEVQGAQQQVEGQLQEATQQVEEEAQEAKQVIERGTKEVQEQ